MLVVFVVVVVIVVVLIVLVFVVIIIIPRYAELLLFALLVSANFRCCAYF